MTIWEAIVLGIVQGLTEFLPVSSSGHLVLFQGFFGLDDMLLFDVLLHAGTLFAVLLVYWQQVLDLFKKPFKKMGLLALATLPAVVLMLLFRDVADTLFGGSYLCFGFLFTAILLLTTELLVKNYEKKKALAAANGTDGAMSADGLSQLVPVPSLEIDWKTALIMGAAQGFAALPPGVSRSGSTICAGVLCGKSRKEVADFSFMMSLPVIAGSTLVSIYELIKGGGSAGFGVPQILTGMVFAFVSGVFAIKLMLKLIQKCNYKWFSLYLFLLATIVFLNEFVVQMW